MSSKYKPLAPLAGYLCFLLKAFLAVQVLAVADQIWTHYSTKSSVALLNSIEEPRDTTVESPLPAGLEEEGPQVEENKSETNPSESLDATPLSDLRELEQESVRLKQETDALIAESERIIEEADHVLRSANTMVVSLYASLALYAAYALLYVITSILFLKWVYRTYRNLRAFSGVEMKRSPAWAVWSYFVPIASLFIPPAVMEEMWVVSHRSASGGLAGLWWLLVVVSNFVGQGITNSYTRALASQNPLEAMASDRLFLLTLGIDLVDVAVTALTLMLVTRITAAYKQHIVERLIEVSSEVATST